MRTRRNVFQKGGFARPNDAHLGLWIDKFLPMQPVKGRATDEEKAARGKHLHDAAAIDCPAAYRKAFERRERMLQQAQVPEDWAVVPAEASASGRLVVGLGAHTVLEVGIHLDHTWGMPVIPGSALKGLAAAAARQLAADPAWHGEDGESYRTLFGTTDEQGAVRFLDAWWKPEPGKKPVYLDVMTVHHAEYYQSGSAPPSDTDSPNPVSFLSTTGTFVLAVEGPAEWCDAALELLSHGMAHLGVGAKTNAGYGRMTLKWKSAVERRNEEKKRQFDALPLTERLPTLHEERLLLPVAEQQAWLQSEGRAAQYGATELEWKAALRSTYVDAIAQLRATAAGIGPTEFEKIEERLQQHLGLKPDKKSKPFKKWTERRDNLRKELEKAKGTDANRDATRAAIGRWLAWLDDSGER